MKYLGPIDNSQVTYVGLHLDSPGTRILYVDTLLLRTIVLIENTAFKIVR